MKIRINSVPLHLLDNSIYAKGGTLRNKSNGADWPTNGVTEFNNGGRHEENPNQGIPQGIAPDGLPNLVEEGEIKWNDQQYIFSDRLTPSDALIERWKLPKSYKEHTYAYLIKHSSIYKEAMERPNDPISQALCDQFLDSVMEDLETVKKEKQAADILDKLDNMSPEELADLNAQLELELELKQQLEQQAEQELAMALQLMQQEQMQQQMNPADMQQLPMNPQELAMMLLQAMQQLAMLQLLMQMQPSMQLPMMGACGGRLHAEGGELNPEELGMTDTPMQLPMMDELIPLDLLQAEAEAQLLKQAEEEADTMPWDNYAPAEDMSTKELTGAINAILDWAKLNQDRQLAREARKILKKSTRELKEEFVDDSIESIKDEEEYKRQQELSQPVSSQEMAAEGLVNAEPVDLQAPQSDILTQGLMNAMNESPIPLEEEASLGMMAEGGNLNQMPQGTIPESLPLQLEETQMDESLEAMRAALEGELKQAQLELQLQELVAFGQDLQLIDDEISIKEAEDLLKAAEQQGLAVDLIQERDIQEIALILNSMINDLASLEDTQEPSQEVPQEQIPQLSLMPSDASSMMDPSMMGGTEGMGDMEGMMPGMMAYGGVMSEYPRQRTVGLTVLNALMLAALNQLPLNQVPVNYLIQNQPFTYAYGGHIYDGTTEEDQRIRTLAARYYVDYVKGKGYRVIDSTTGKPTISTYFTDARTAINKSRTSLDIKKALISLAEEETPLLNVFGNSEGVVIRPAREEIVNNQSAEVPKQQVQNSTAPAPIVLDVEEASMSPKIKIPEGFYGVTYNDNEGKAIVVFDKDGTVSDIYDYETGELVDDELYTKIVNSKSYSPSNLRRAAIQLLALIGNDANKASVNEERKKLNSLTIQQRRNYKAVVELNRNNTADNEFYVMAPTSDGKNTVPRKVKYDESSGNYYAIAPDGHEMGLAKNYGITPEMIEEYKQLRAAQVGTTPLPKSEAPTQATSVNKEGISANNGTPATPATPAVTTGTTVSTANRPAAKSTPSANALTELRTLRTQPAVNAANRTAAPVVTERATAEALAAQAALQVANPIDALSVAAEVARQALGIENTSKSTPIFVSPQEYTGISNERSTEAIDSRLKRQLDKAYAAKGIDLNNMTPLQQALYNADYNKLVAASKDGRHSRDLSTYSGDNGLYINNAGFNESLQSNYRRELNRGRFGEAESLKMDENGHIAWDNLPDVLTRGLETIQKIDPFYKKEDGTYDVRGKILVDENGEPINLVGLNLKDLQDSDLTQRGIYNYNYTENPEELYTGAFKDAEGKASQDDFAKFYQDQITEFYRNNADKNYYNSKNGEYDPNRIANYHLNGAGLRAWHQELLNKAKDESLSQLERNQYAELASALERNIDTSNYGDNAWGDTATWNTAGYTADGVKESDDYTTWADEETDGKKVRNGDGKLTDSKFGIRHIPYLLAGLNNNPRASATMYLTKGPDGKYHYVMQPEDLSKYNVSDLEGEEEQFKRSIGDIDMTYKVLSNNYTRNMYYDPTTGLIYQLGDNTEGFKTIDAPEGFKDDEGYTTNWYTLSDPETAPKEGEEEGKGKKRGFSPEGLLGMMRFAPLLNQAVAPSASGAVGALSAGLNSGLNYIDAPRHGEYLKYEPVDTLYRVNQLLSDNNAARRGIMNAANGNVGMAMANLALLNSKAQEQLGKTLLDIDTENWNRKKDVITLHNDVDKTWDAMALQADLANMHNNSIKSSVYNNMANLLWDEALTKAAAENATRNNFFQTLSDIGRELFVMDLINSNPAFMGYGYGSPFSGKIGYTGNRTAAEGGTLILNAPLIIKRRKKLL